MNDRALIPAGMAGAILAAICCATPLIAGVLSLAGLGTWLAGGGLVVLPLVIARFGLIAWGIHRRRAKTACGVTKIHNEGVKP
ncbi:mercury transport protein [Bradyrhizobium zhanjiangense]|uniref:Mercury transport protein n=1 Tax=Bradyrhizobium zhanjiangense TaxID=1325107 RepID=A0ABY0D9D4_9BRAD|nr:mercury transport protein [Bradyrhizobium zhanjiangense]RXG86365.1 mercury transport protein [Bradyrhizobium zhanjiangense]